MDGQIISPGAQQPNEEPQVNALLNSDNSDELQVPVAEPAAVPQPNFATNLADQPEVPSDQPSPAPFQPRPLFAPDQPPAQSSRQKRSKKPLLFILIAIILIAGAAYGAYYWQHKKVNDQGVQINQLDQKVAGLQRQISNSKQQTSSSSTSTSSGSTASNTMVKIPELGIQISVPSALQDLTYVTAPENSFGTGTSGTAAYLSTKALAAADVACTASTSKTTGAPLGVIAKVNGTYPAEPTASSGILILQEKDYYIAYQPFQSTCSAKPNVQTIQTNDKLALKVNNDTVSLTQ